MDFEKLLTVITKMYEDFKSSQEQMRDEYKESQEQMRDEYKESQEQMRDDFTKSQERMRGELKESQEQMRDELKESQVELRAELREGFKSVNERLSSLERTVVKIENEHGDKLSALFDGYIQNSEKLDRIELKVNKHEEFIIKRIK